MRAVDRANFINTNPYIDSPQGIGYAVTISAPHMVRSFTSKLIVAVLKEYVHAIQKNVVMIFIVQGST